MAESQFSQLWYRVAALRPRLRSHVEVQRHHYRGRLWHVIRDAASGRVYRFSPSAQAVIGLMDGRRTVQELWESACAQLGDAAPSQDEVIQLLGQLHGADLLQTEVSPDTAELFERFEKQRRGDRLRRFLSPMSVKLPLLDPERFLQRGLRYVRWLYTRAGFAAWLAVVLLGAVLAARHWPELTRDVTSRVLAPGNLLLLALVFPVVKALHELGHAFAVKAWGGEVHEMGVMLLVLMPIPYVDASAAAAFRDQRRRAVVGAAGMMVELFLASLAMFVWLLVEPGLLRSLCYSVMLIAGVSTVVFNGNPLLRFDGYYILSDLLQIPNLAQRSTQHWGWLAQRYLFDARDLEAPQATPGERRWFVAYAPAALAYRLTVSIGIVLFLATQFFVVGVILALWTLTAMLVFPVVRALALVLRSPRLHEHRARAIAATAAVVGGAALLLLLVPMPLRTHADGIIWVPEQALVRAETSGFFSRFRVGPGSRVRAGDVLCESYDPMLTAQLAQHEARLAELEARWTAEVANGNRVEAQVLEDQLTEERGRLARTRERAEGLTLRARTDGVFVVAEPAADMPGRFVKQGTEIGYVLNLEAPTARVVVAQSDIDLVRQRTRAVEVRSLEMPGTAITATIEREVPAGSDRLPSKALTVEGGGRIATDPRDASGLKSLTRQFQYDIALQSAVPFARLGGHVRVRFDHGWEPLAWQWYRRLRQLFLARFDA